MNGAWKAGYKGISISFTISKNSDWESFISNFVCQLGLGWVQLRLYFYDEPKICQDILKDALHKGKLNETL